MLDEDVLDEDDEPAIEELEEQPVSSLEEQKALRIVSEYVQSNFNDPAVLRHIYALDDTLYEDRQNKQKQPAITNYFMPLL